MKVLVVDDVRTNRLLASYILTKGGHEVKAVGSGIKAIEQLSREDFDIVLMDIQMPDMNGIEAAAIIRSNISDVRCHEIPILAFSATIDETITNFCRKAGINECLPKPINPADLIKVIERHVGICRSRSN